MQPVTSSPQIGAILTARRKALGLTQSQVAQCLGLSQNRLSELESRPGTMTAAQLLALATILGLTLQMGEIAKAAAGRQRS